MKSMTKKITATALFGVLAVSAFAGCGGAEETQKYSIVDRISDSLLEL